MILLLITCMFLVIVAAFFFNRLVLERLYIEDYGKKAVLITGCDTGFGHDLAIKCLSKGMTVFAACLTKEGMDSLVAKSGKTPGELHTLTMDVGEDKSVQKCRTFIEKTLENINKDLFAVVNNAGIQGNAMYDDFLTVEDYIHVVNVNTFGVVRVTKAFKDMIKKSRGRIVTVASSFSRLALPGTGPYAVSKFGVAAYCDAIRQELKPFGVEVSIIIPGFFRTQIVDPETFKKNLDSIWENASTKTKNEYGSNFFETYKEQLASWLDKRSRHVEWVTDAMFHAIIAKFPRARYTVGYDANLQYLPATFFPTRIQDALILLFIKIEKGILPPPAAVLENQRTISV